MKTLLILISLTAFKAMAIGQQFYYGGNLSASIEKYYRPKTKEIKTGINDISLSAPLGYANKWFVGELTPAMTMSLIPSVSGLVGIRGNLSDNTGVHFLIGYRDEMEFLKKWSMRNYLHPSTTIRLWINTFSIESKYTFRKEEYGGSTFEIGIGVIGF